MKKKYQTQKKNRVHAAAKEILAGADEALSPKLPENIEREALKSKGRGGRVTEAEKEARLLLLQRLLFRRIPKKDIAQTMGVTPRHLSRMVKELEDRTKNEMAAIDFPVFVGGTMNFYDEVRGMALLVASSKGETTRDKLNAMNVALRAEGSKHEFLTLCGVYKGPYAADIAKQIVSPDQKKIGVDPQSVMHEVAKELLKMTPGQITDELGLVEGGVVDAEFDEPDSDDNIED